MDRNLSKAVSNIVKRCGPTAVATYNGGRGILVVMESSCTSRAKRTEAVRDAMGRPGRAFDLAVYTPGEILELKGVPGSPVDGILAGCAVVHGSLDGLL
ncbi:MAG: hypothetical protein Q4Q62_05440 [Thermoplasmata archaeon]|nr:hypothetical protein [Thermoplasmata archaeon]